MKDARTRSTQSGGPVAASARAITASAAQHDGHFESSPDHIVKVVHQVRPEATAVQGPTDFEAHGRLQTETLADVRVTPESASVWEALPPEAGSSQDD